MSTTEDTKPTNTTSVKPKTKSATKKPKLTKQEIRDAGLAAYDALVSPLELIHDAEVEFNIIKSETNLDILRSGLVSTGMLMSDVMLAGGLYPGGWYTVAGLEGSAKSTHLMTWLGSLYESGVPTIQYWDYENSTSDEYIQSIMKTLGYPYEIHDLFGMRDGNGSWKKKPRIHFYNESTGETFYKSVNRFLKTLPDKVYLDGKWYLAFDRTKANIAKFKGTKYKIISGKIAVESPNGATMQAIFLVDSYAAMVPEADDEGDGNNSMGLDARMHSKHAKKIWSKLKKKMCTVIGVNQLRTNPNQRFGNPLYEAGGLALKFVSGARLWQTSRACPYSSVTGQEVKEPSIEVKGGEDTYRFVHMKAVKNKLGVDNLEVWHRLWVKDGSGAGRGLDPVFDTAQFLSVTGQLTGFAIDKPMVKFNIKLNDGSFEYTDIKYAEFKGLITLTGRKLRQLLRKLNLDTNPNIRVRSFKALEDNSAMDLYFDNLNGTLGDHSEVLYEIMEKGVDSDTLNEIGKILKVKQGKDDDMYEYIDDIVDSIDGDPIALMAAMDKHYRKLSDLKQKDPISIPTHIPEAGRDAYTRVSQLVYEITSCGDEDDGDV